jgi:ADP-ribose pyrophosphatase YjhB (NUDIX family)
MQNYFQGNREHPKHLSVGAVLLNERAEVCCHHFTKADLKGYWSDLGINDFYILMRETLEPNKPLEHALHRGLLEEFGAKAELLDYIGSIKSHFKDKGVEVEKTTVYFRCKLVSQDLSLRDTSDIEGKSQIEWQTKEFLTSKMKEQARKYHRTDIDESEILEKLM